MLKSLNKSILSYFDYQKCLSPVSKETFSYISYRVWEYLWKCCKRRHPKKGKRWVANKYFRTINGVSWQFSCEIKGRRGNAELFTLFNIAKHPIIRHIKVKGTSSPFDAELANYWVDRSQKIGKSKWAKGRKFLNYGS